ncbi:MAG: hypothetical protein N3B21_13340 [Clostridia bacterium]|nr:hypothetical protein [Clostridia bacterium]
MSTNHIICPVCNSNKLIAKYEATYIYSYIIDSDAPGLKNTEEFLPYLFDTREQKEAKQYVECGTCGAQYPCYFTEGNKGIDFSLLQRAAHSDHAPNSHYLS